MMSKTKTSPMIANALNETYTYLNSRYVNKELAALKKILKSISGIKSFDFSAAKGKDYTYENIQSILSTLNEKESIRKSKGVYYTPNDVVQFIIKNKIKSVYGKLKTNGLHVMDLNCIPYKSFCTSKTVLDPTCGAGEFLLSAFETKLDLLDNHVKNITGEMLVKTAGTIYGNDINTDSTTISKIRLFLCALRRCGVKKCSKIVPVLNNNFTNKDFISQVTDFGHKFDLIIGNPPFVEDKKSGLQLSKRYGNIYANVLINSADLLNDNGSLGFIIPLSYVSTPRMQSIRDELFKSISEQYILSYADRPDCLFKSVHQKLCILIGKKRNGKKSVFTGNYKFWYNNERAALFEQTAVVKNTHAVDEYIPKLGTEFDAEIYKKIRKTRGRKSLAMMTDAGDDNVYVNMRAAFWIKAFRAKHTGSEYKCFSFNSPGMADYFSCLINSSLFWWYWICVSDCWHITHKELQGFTAPRIDDFTTVSRLASALEKKLEQTKKHVKTKQTEYEYKHKSCVAEIHDIDDYINSLYGLTDAESLYIKNFAYRYRVSGGLELRVIDLFAGCGGLSLGFIKEGFTVEKAVEIDASIANTYKMNHPKVDVIVDDIRNIDNSGVFAPGDADVIIGGPPCQGFSMAGARIRRGFIDDPRNYLFKHYFNVVKTVHPKVFVMENVKGMLTMQGGKIFNEIIKIFSDPEMLDGQPYEIHYKVVKAVEFGVPQKRERLIILGSAVKGLDFDYLWEKTTQSIKNNHPKYFDSVTVRDAIGNLGKATKDGIINNPEPATEYEKYLSCDEPVLKNHKQTNHSKLAVERMKKINNGENYTSLDEQINSVHSGSYGRLCWDEQAPTITTRFDTPAGGRFIHPVENRTLTPREAARIQSFPDDFVFYGNRTSICKQIGNAVPPKVSYFLAKLVKNILDLEG